MDQECHTNSTILQAIISEPVRNVSRRSRRPDFRRAEYKILLGQFAGPCYIKSRAMYSGKKVAGNGRRIADATNRLRPYNIPERSRTKSENSVELDSYTDMNCSSSSSSGTTNFFADGMNSNSNSMMETSDAYLNSDGTSSSNQTITNNGCTTFSCNQVMPNSHFLNSNQYFRPIKCASLTNQLKKCKSLESVRVENIDGSQPSHEMEFVSSRIQKLKVHE